MTLEQLGWNFVLQQQWAASSCPDTIPARVASVQRGRFGLFTTDGSLTGELTGRFHFDADALGGVPGVGDWVAARVISTHDRHALIEHVFPRRTCLARAAAGTQVQAQVLAANVDVLFIVCGLDHDWNMRRLERYVLLAQGSGIPGVVVLNKADLCADVPFHLAEAHSIANGAPVIAVSAVDPASAQSLAAWLAPGITAVLLGSSGAGKSTLTNQLLGGDRQATGTVRSGDSRGRHTTSHRELFMLPSGGLLIDSPGIRELQPWASPESIDAAFADIEALAAQCRFRDCHHGTEPGCAVQAALAEGRLSTERLASYGKLGRELAHLERQIDQQAALEQKRLWKNMHKQQRAIYKRR